MTYKDLSMAAFVRGYMIVMKSEQDTKVKDHMALHLEELMENMDVYGWDKVWHFTLPG